MNHPLASRIGIELMGALIASGRKGPVVCVTCGWKGRRDLVGPIGLRDTETGEVQEVIGLDTLRETPCPKCESDVIPKEAA